jgi:hypothetical protein
MITKLAAGLRDTLRPMTRDIRQREDLPSADQKFLSDIERFGWNVTTVGKNKGDVGPDWAFSTGLFSSYQHPEIALFGLEFETMAKIINNIGGEVKRGMKFEPEIEYQEIFARCGCRFRPVQSRYYTAHFGWAIWFYEGDPFPVLQCFWPDKEGKYPWEASCSQFVVSAQPLLFE